MLIKDQSFTVCYAKVYFIIMFLFILYLIKRNKTVQKISDGTTTQIIFKLIFYKKTAIETKQEYCKTRIEDKHVFLTYNEGGSGKNCIKNSQLTYIGPREISNVSKCIKENAAEQNIEIIQVLTDKENYCEEKCSKKSCTLYYDLNIKRYIASCEPKILQQKHFNLCSRIIADSKSNVLVIAVVSVLAVSTVIIILTYLYRRNKISNRLETVSRVIIIICFTTF